MDHDELPQPEERGAIVPPRGTRPTAVGTATPPPPKPPRYRHGRSGKYRPDGPLWLILLTIGIAGLLLTMITVFPIVAIGAIIGGTAGWIGFFRTHGRAMSRWGTVSAVGGGIGGALAEVYWGEGSAVGGLRAPVIETLVMSANMGMLIASLGLGVALSVGALFALHRPRWVDRLARWRPRVSRAGA